MLPSIQFERVPALQPITFGDVIERVAGFFLLLLASPILIGSSLVVAVLSRRSPFVAHLRIGRHNRPFWMLKLRSMWESEDSALGKMGWVEYVVAEPAENGKSAQDPRITSRFAAFCRRHSIDEIPQFWHLLHGEMSLVGPRPLTRIELLRYYGPHASELVSVKPGLTGLWQVSGRSSIKFPDRAALDLKLVRELTPRMYLIILVRTFWTLVAGQGAW
ncbi:MAG TPA: sugar transferase [Bryobacteraceae bacterium]|nr:sugar transferase [Bryobacteraceae bacterium]